MKSTSLGLSGFARRWFLAKCGDRLFSSRARTFSVVSKFVLWIVANRSLGGYEQEEARTWGNDRNYLYTHEWWNSGFRRAFVQLLAMVSPAKIRFALEPLSHSLLFGVMDRMQITTVTVVQSAHFPEISPSAFPVKWLCPCNNNGVIRFSCVRERCINCSRSVLVRNENSLLWQLWCQPYPTCAATVEISNTLPIRVCVLSCGRNARSLLGANGVAGGLYMDVIVIPSRYTDRVSVSLLLSLEVLGSCFRTHTATLFVKNFGSSQNNFGYASSTILSNPMGVLYTKDVQLLFVAAAKMFGLEEESPSILIKITVCTSPEKGSCEADQALLFLVFLL